MKSLYESILSNVGVGKNSPIGKAMVVKELIEHIFGKEYKFDDVYNKYVFDSNDIESSDIQKKATTLYNQLKKQLPEITAPLHKEKEVSKYGHVSIIWKITGIKFPGVITNQAVIVRMGDYYGSQHCAIMFTEALGKEINELYR